MNFTIDGDPSSWDERRWIDAFPAAISTKNEFRLLRVTVFSNTVLAVKRGGYLVDGEAVSLADPKSTGMSSTFYTQPPTLSRVDAASRALTQIAVQNADCVEVAQVLLYAGFRPAVLNMANRQTPGGGVLGGAGAQEENLFRRGTRWDLAAVCLTPTVCRLPTSRPS